MDEKYDKVCTLLDKLTIDSLVLMQEHIRVKLELERSMSDGENQLAKTRYITGHQSVSKLQLPTEDSPEFEAVAVVHPYEDDKLFGKNSYDLEIRRNKKTANSINNNKKKNSSSNIEINNEKKKEKNSDTEEEDGDKEAKNKNGVQDPIRWFGVLVPQSLHSAQNRFRQSLLWAVRATNIQTQLNETCGHMKKLYKLKEKLAKEQA